MWQQIVVGMGEVPFTRGRNFTHAQCPPPPPAGEPTVCATGVTPRSGGTRLHCLANARLDASVTGSVCDPASAPAPASASASASASAPASAPASASASAPSTPPASASPPAPARNGAGARPVRRVDPVTKALLGFSILAPCSGGSRPSRRQEPAVLRSLDPPCARCRRVGRPAVRRGKRRRTSCCESIRWRSRRSRCWRG